MAHFIGYVQGNRGEASRLGTKSSGIGSTARGWDIGASLSISHNEERDTDTLFIHIDKGSNNKSSRIIANVFKTADGYNVNSLISREELEAWLNEK